MNTLDLIVIIIMAACVLVGVWRGFVRTVLGFFKFILAIIITNLIYPHVGRFLRGIDGFFGALKTSISQIMGLEAAHEAGTRYQQAEFINEMPLPGFLRDQLMENNNAVVHSALGADTFGDFVAGFLAGIAINIISMVAVFAVVYLLLTILTRVLHIVSKLPVINTLNKLLGGVLGALWGLLLIWVILGVGLSFFGANSRMDVATLLEGSFIAAPLFEANFFLDFILRLFP